MICNHQNLIMVPDKKVTILLSVFFGSILLVGIGCQTPKPTVSLPPAAVDLQAQVIPETSKQKMDTSTEPTSIVNKNTEPELTANGTRIYRGSWFDIEYPKEFSAASLSLKESGYVEQNEASFTSPDGSVEFFIFSPMWSGDPANYLIITPNERVISDTSSESGSGYARKIIRWVTIESNDGSYYRSFVSIKEQVGTGSDLHHVFGIKYINNDAYNRYRDAYISFKESLRQYAD